jgi:hypothetical protein
MGEVFMINTIMIRCSSTLIGRVMARAKNLAKEAQTTHPMAWSMALYWRPASCCLYSGIPGMPGTST